MMNLLFVPNRKKIRRRFHYFLEALTFPCQKKYIYLKKPFRLAIFEISQIQNNARIHMRKLSHFNDLEFPKAQKLSRKTRKFIVLYTTQQTLFD